MLFLDLLIQGLLQGSIYGLIAVGLTLVYGLLRILHVAHAGLFTLGGYICVIVTNQTSSFLLAVLTSMILVGLAGMIIYRICYQPILDQPPFVPLIASIGLFIAMEELFRIFFGAYGLSFTELPLQEPLALMQINLKQAEWITIASSVGFVAMLAFLANRTKLGLAWKATVTDPEMASSFGVNIIQVRYLNFFIGSSLAAVSGCMMAVLNNLVEPTMGSVPSYKMLAIIVLGGLGNVRGTLIAAVLLGIIESYGTIYLDDLLDRDSIAFVFLIIGLMIRPQGLFQRH